MLLWWSCRFILPDKCTANDEWRRHLNDDFWHSAAMILSILTAQKKTIQPKKRSQKWEINTCISYTLDITLFTIFLGNFSCHRGFWHQFKAVRDEHCLIWKKQRRKQTKNAKQKSMQKIPNLMTKLLPNKCYALISLMVWITWYRIAHGVLATLCMRTVV